MIMVWSTCLPGIAQSVTPMRNEVKSFSDKFAVRIAVGNPYPTRVTFNVRAYDAEFRPIDAVISPGVLHIAANDSRNVTIVVPFAGGAERKIRICAEGLFGADNTSKVRTQVCGRFLGRFVAQ